MSEHIDFENFSTEAGYPYGGWAAGKGFDILWQAGPLEVDGERKEPNGAFVEYVLEAVLQRLKYYQESPFKCQENQDAIEHIEAAIKRLNDRTTRRTEEGTEGTWNK